VYLFTLLLVACACSPAPDLRELYQLDCRPPELLGVTAETASSLTIRFSEPAAVDPASLAVFPALPVSTVRQQDTSALIEFAEPQRAGEPYTLEGLARDEKGNSLSFLTAFYGKNDEVPPIRINEFTCRGADRHPDAVELAVLGPGRTAGVALFDGTSDDWDTAYVLPDIKVKAGDFIVVHFKPQGTADEVTETNDPTVSGGYDASPSAYDCWVKDSTGLPGNNGVLALYENPTGRLLDCVVYSNRTSDSDERYGGFGSAAMQRRVRKLYEAGGWRGASASPAPEDAVTPEGSTATRSICRDPDSSDTDTNRDWYIVKTRGVSFGSVNCAERYEGK
jgi:hypothetical protein